MTKDVILCEECKYFEVTLEVDAHGKCSHINALPFPQPTDYCSMAELKAGKRRGLTEDQQVKLLQAVYNQRRNN